MGVIDMEGKQYLSINSFFADMFNFLLHDGKPIIQPEKLRELDTTQIAIPYGNGAGVPVQKYRDLLKLWSAYMDDSAVYVMLGAELQGRTHYAMPVKKGLYDMLGYARQVDEARNSYRKKTEDGNLYVDNGILKIKLTIQSDSSRRIRASCAALQRLPLRNSAIPPGGFIRGEIETPPDGIEFFLPPIEEGVSIFALVKSFCQDFEKKTN